VLRNTVRTAVLGLTRGALTLPPVKGPTARYWRRLNQASAEFALLADIAMGSLGGDLKRKEKITGRFADWFSWLFLASATLRRFAADGQPKEDLAFVRYACEHAFAVMRSRCAEGCCRARATLAPVASSGPWPKQGRRDHSVPGRASTPPAVMARAP